MINTMSNNQTEANKRWQEKNKERNKYLKARSTARSFIRDKIEFEDIAEFEELLNNKKTQFQEERYEMIKLLEEDKL